MDSSQVEKYLQVVEGMVMDEEKIVTFKQLSRTLGINVNAAKQLLYVYFLKHQKKTPCLISSTHLLAGLTKNGLFLVSIVSDDNLDGAYTEFEKITSEHIYSIQKCKASSLEKNSQILFAADSSLPPGTSYPIKYHKSLEEKTVNEPRETTEQDVQLTTGLKSDDKVKENEPTKQSPRKNDKQPANKSRSISHFFNNQSQRKNVVRDEKREEKTEETNGKSGQASKNVVEEELRELTIEDSPEPERVSEKPSSSGKQEVEEKEKEKKKQQKKKKKGENVEKKKRKRILSASEDSESDEEKRDAVLCAESAVLDTAECLLISDDDNNKDKLPDNRNKRKRKKLVDRTVLLDNGFMETHKEVLYETDSDEELPKPKKEEAKSSSRSEVSVEKVGTKQESVNKKVKFAAQKGNSKKQSTLLSFFKKG